MYHIHSRLIGQFKVLEVSAFKTGFTNIGFQNYVKLMDKITLDLDYLAIKAFEMLQSTPEVI